MHAHPSVCEIPFLSVGLLKGSSAISYLDLLRPLNEEVWRKDGNCHESRRPKNMQRYWLMNRRNNADPTGISDEQYALACAMCEICPVQWQCVSFAIVQKDKFHIWAVDIEDRKVLKRERDWRELLAVAEAERRSVAAVVRDVRALQAERVAAAALLDHSESVHSAV